MKNIVLLCLGVLLIPDIPFVAAKDDLRDIIAPYVNNRQLSEKHGIIESELMEMLEYVERRITKLPYSVQNLTCNACEATFSFLMSLHSSILLEAVNYLVTEFCYLTRIDIYDVCKGAVFEMTPSIFYSFFHHYLDPHRICPEIDLCPEYYVEESLQAYINETLKDKPKRDPPQPTKRATYKVVHLTDIHFNWHYTPGTEADCDAPECCVPWNGPAKSNKSAAGTWGTLRYNCDIPRATVEQAMQFIEERLQPDVLLWTGDTVDHTIWNQTVGTNINATIWVSDLMKSTFNSTRTQVFPIDGNHECFPVDIFDYNSDAKSTLKRAFGDIWKDWIGEEAAEEVKRNMFYSKYDEKFNIRVIAIDTNTCNNLNFYLIENPTDPGNMLSWLKLQLLDAESKNQFVYIIGHIPTGQCMYQWGARYEALVDRFSYTIRGQFVGHTHTDLFQVFYAQDRKTPVGVQYIAPSLTTYTNINPSIREFEMDVDTGLPINMKQYRLNLTKYNSLGNVNRIEWDLAYDYLSEYDMPDMSLNSFENLRQQTRDNETIGRKINNNHFTHEVNVTAKTNYTVYYCNMLSNNLEQAACSDGRTVSEQKGSIIEELAGPWIEKKSSS